MRVSTLVVFFRHSNTSINTTRAARSIDAYRIESGNEVQAIITDIDLQSTWFNVDNGTNTTFSNSFIIPIDNPCRNPGTSKAISKRLQHCKQVRS